MGQQISFADLFEEAVACAFDKQLAFGDLIGDANWRVSLADGQIIFGEQRSCAIQILGSESASDHTWLWGWANAASNIPPDLLRDALQLQATGQEYGVHELITALLPISADLDGHHISSVASMLCHADAYYRCPYDGGALFVTVYGVYGPNEMPAAPHPAIHITSVFPQVIAAYSVANHRRALASYLRFWRFAVVETDTTLTGSDVGGNVITATFDDVGRLTRLSTQAQPIPSVSDPADPLRMPPESR